MLILNVKIKHQVLNTKVISGHPWNLQLDVDLCLATAKPQHLATQVKKLCGNRE